LRERPIWERNAVRTEERPPRGPRGPRGRGPTGPDRGRAACCSVARGNRVDAVARPRLIAAGSARRCPRSPWSLWYPGRPRLVPAFARPCPRRPGACGRGPPLAGPGCSRALSDLVLGALEPVVGSTPGRPRLFTALCQTLSSAPWSLWWGPPLAGPGWSLPSAKPCPRLPGACGTLAGPGGHCPLPDLVLVALEPVVGVHPDRPRLIAPI